MHIRNEMRAALKTMPEERLTKLVLTESDFFRSKVEEHEIKIDGRMYDIARLQYAGGKVIVWCLHDEAEDNLLAFLDAVSNRAHQDSTPVPQSILQFLSLTFLVPEFQLPLSYTAAAKTETTYRLPVYSILVPIQSPPPRAKYFFT